MDTKSFCLTVFVCFSVWAALHWAAGGVRAAGVPAGGGRTGHRQEHVLQPLLKHVHVRLRRLGTIQVHCTTALRI